MKKENRVKSSVSATFKVGAISLAFLIIGYQSAMFIHRAAVLRIEAGRDRPDTVYVIREIPVSCDAGNITADAPQQPSSVIRRESRHSPAVAAVRKATRRVENFPFNPNTIDKDGLMRLGFSDKQAQAILNYRAKGGHFNVKEDFAKSFVVADSVYRRLEPYIDIPLLYINKADSAAFDALPGIGPYFASKMVSYRESIGAYRRIEQLMDIERFDLERFNSIKDLIICYPAGDGGIYSEN